MSPEFKAQFSKHAGGAFVKQLTFADYLGERGWGIDISQGIVNFGDDLSFPVQLIGTEVDGNNTWLWAWANEASDLPKKLLKSSLELKELGEQYNIPELVNRSYAREPVNGHMLAMFASGLNKDSCYYRGPYDGGALYFLVNNVPDDIWAPVEAQRAITVITQVISLFDVEHNTLVESFLQSQGFIIEHSTNKIIATRSANAIHCTFDEQGRIINIEGTLSNSAASLEKKSWWKFWK